MEIIQLLKKNSKESPDALVVIGQYFENNGKVILTPKPDDDSIQFEFELGDILEGPIDFESNTAPYNRSDVKAIRVKKNGKIKFIKNGMPKEISLQSSSSRDHNLIAMSSLSTPTYCIGLLEFECGTDKLLGPCIFGWDCS